MYVPYVKSVENILELAMNKKGFLVLLVLITVILSSTGNVSAADLRGPGVFDPFEKLKIDPVLKRSDQFFGRIVAGTSERVLLALYDSVVTDFGSDKNVQVGDVFSIYEKNTTVKKDSQGRFIYEKVGEITLKKIFDEKSVALVTRAFKEIYMDGDGVYYLDKVKEAAPPTTPVPAAAPMPAPQPAAGVQAMPEQPVKEQPVIDAAKQFEQERIYFAFDDAGLTDDSIEVLKRKADYLKSHPEKTTLIEGHCDERGSVEYNLALGERRAAAARNFIISEGVDPGRIRTVSYGKEQPLNPDHNEEAWAQNRRCEFILE